jgi:FtsZ-binding cell division protein ZapB
MQDMACLLKEHSDLQDAHLCLQFENKDLSAALSQMKEQEKVWRDRVDASEGKLVQVQKQLAECENAFETTMEQPAK